MSETTAMSYLIHSAVLWSRHQHRQPCWSHQCTGHEAPVLATTLPRPLARGRKSAPVQGWRLDNFTPSDGGVLMVFASGPEMCQLGCSWIDTQLWTILSWWRLLMVGFRNCGMIGKKHWTETDRNILLSTPFLCNCHCNPWILYPLR